MDGAGFVYVVTGDLRIFNDFDDRGLSGLFVVFNRLGYAETETATGNGLLKLGEEFILEHAVE